MKFPSKQTGIETENYIPDQIRKAMSISIENRKPTAKTFKNRINRGKLPKPKNRSYLTQNSKNRPKN
jgi:hypothetical protein